MCVEFCAQCQSSETNFDCVFPDNLERFSRECEGGAGGACFTRIMGEIDSLNFFFLLEKLSIFISADGTTLRGCGSLANDTTCFEELCQTCMLITPGSTPCNTVQLPADRLTCYNCTGEFNSTCGDLNRNDTMIHPISCPLFRNDDRCFATRQGGVVTRGCLSTARGRCDNPNSCSICFGHACNNLEASTLNSAFSIKSAINLTLIAFVASIIRSI